MVIAIDGPAGSGKTTVSRLLAEKLNASYLDTGATYRALTLKAIKEQTDLEDFQAVKTIAEKMNIEFRDRLVFLDNEDVTREIRMPYIDQNISKVAANPYAREVLVGLQRRLAEGKNVVVEGRDITTVVFPNAEYKFYLDANVEERARRRCKEFKERGVDVQFDALKNQVVKRDQADFSRESGPLKKADDACYIDTTALSIEQVVDNLAAHITL